MIKNDSLRNALYSLSTLVDKIEQRIIIANTDNNNYMVPYCYKNLNLRTITSRANENYRKRIGDSKLEKNNYEMILMDREFENLLIVRLSYAEEMLPQYQGLKKYLEDIKQLLENNK